METVGIIIPSKERFDEWVRTFGIPQERYVFLDRKEKCFGCEFTKILKSVDWHELKDSEEILESAKLRIR